MKLFLAICITTLSLSSCKNNPNQQEKTSDLVEDTSEIPNSKADK